MTHTASTAVDEIEHARRECLELLAQIKTFCPVHDDEQYPKLYRLLATPLMYSAWERCFTLCHSIGLRALRDHAKTPHGLHPKQRSIWLVREPFYQSFLQKSQNASDRDRTTRGHYEGLSDFVSKLDAWSVSPLNASNQCSEFVMTFSNVNPEVVQLNAGAIGISDFPDFKKIKFGRLHNLVSRRNEIGHGAHIEPPSDEEFRDLLAFTNDLITDYCHAFAHWIRTKLGTPTNRTYLRRFLRLQEILAITRARLKIEPRQPHAQKRSS